ncbi:DAK2 domain-containing protein, partial [Streptomyces sp. NPDC002690]
MPQPPDDFDAVAVRTWCSLALEALGRERAAIDAINVYPVPDGDTGTNLFLTVESARAAVEAVFAAHEGDSPGPGSAGPGTAEAVRAMAHGALIGARGNSGTILAQLLRGTAAVLAEGGDADHLARALADPAGERLSEGGGGVRLGGDAASLRPRVPDPQR